MGKTVNNYKVIGSIIFDYKGVNTLRITYSLRATEQLNGSRKSLHSTFLLFSLTLKLKVPCTLHQSIHITQRVRTPR